MSYRPKRLHDARLRLGPVKLVLGGVGCLGLIITALAFYAGSALLWGWVFMLIHGAVIGNGHSFDHGYWTKPWGFRVAVIPWGLLAPFWLG